MVISYCLLSPAKARNMFSPTLVCVSVCVSMCLSVTTITIFEHWFSISTTCVKWGTYLSCFFNLSCGVRQGGVLSPYLFAVYIDSFFEKVRLTSGCYMKWYCVNILMYADDILLLAPSVSSLHNLLGIHCVF